MNTTVRIPPRAYSYRSGYSSITVTNAGNCYTNVDSTTYATFDSPYYSTSSDIPAIYLRNFDLSLVPEDADITMLYIKLKMRRNKTPLANGFRPAACMHSGSSQTYSFGTWSPQVTSTNSTAITTFQIAVTNSTSAKSVWATIKSAGTYFSIAINIGKSNPAYYYVYGAEIAVTYNEEKNINKVVYGNKTLIDLTSDTIEASKMLSGITAHDKYGAIITGSISTKTSSNVTFSNTTVTVPAGYYAGQVSKTAIDADLVAENIKKDINIFGVTGTYEGGGVESVTQDQEGYVIFDDDPGNQIVVNSLSVTSNGTYTAEEGYAYSPVTVNVPTGITPTGTLSITSNGTYDVTNYAGANVSVPDSSASPVTARFVDYDGTVLHTYSNDEFQELSAMPANPSHAGLTAQGWNWSLSEAKAKLNSFESGTLNIGQMYITDDGKTRFYITMEDYDLSRPMTVGFYVSSGTTVTLDWGDNSQTVSATNTAYSVYSHSYSSAGNYVITFSVSSGGTLHFIGYSGNSSVDGYNCLCKWNGSTTTKVAYIFSRLKKIEIGSNVAIHHHRFYYLEYHSSITISNGTTYEVDSYTRVFSYNSGLKCLVFPVSFIGFDNSILDNADDLTIVSYPSSYTGVMGLLNRRYDIADSCYFSPGITSIGSSLFKNQTFLKYVEIPDTVVSIGAYAFQNCTSLETIVIPSGVTTIGNYAFDGCRSLKSVTIPSTVTSIGSYAFQNCASLSSVSLESGLTTINNYAFAYCYRLRSINIPSTVTALGTYVFYMCYSLETITFSTGITAIPGSVCRGCRNLKTVNILGNVTSIGQYSFLECSRLEECNIPNTVVTYSTGPFQSCKSLRSVIIPEGATSIPSFMGCYALTYFYIPSTATSINSDVFSACYAIKDIHIAATTPPTLSSSSSFNYAPTDYVIYVPQGSLTAYQEASNWSTLASHMQEEPA